MEFNFINPGHITTTFHTVAIMGEECEIKLFGEVSHLSLGRSQTLSPISRRSVRHTKILVTKRPCDEMTGYPIKPSNRNHNDHWAIIQRKCKSHCCLFIQQSDCYYQDTEHRQMN